MKNKLYYGDNLDVLRHRIAPASVDLVYLDPPFSSNQAYNAVFAQRHGSRAAAQSHAFEDTWRWDVAAQASFESVVEHGGKVSQAMQAFRTFLGTSDMMAYLAMMAPRLMLLRDALVSTGSLFLHCDPTASHYLKILLDGIFGAENFRNEIVWRRTPFSGSSKSRAKQFPRSHDILLYYSKSPSGKFKPLMRPYEDEYYKRFRNPDNDPRGPYQSVLLKTYSDETFKRLKAENRLIKPQREGAKWRYKQFQFELKGRPTDDIWTDVNALNPMAQERLGYPTQKPEALVERIIEATTEPGDVVLDPFCGCGTAIAAAQKMGRRWIGIDITYVAIHVIKKRLRDQFGQDVDETYEVHGEPTALPDAEQLAADNRYQFEWWAVSQLGAVGKQRTGADRGVDGRLYFHERPGGATKQIIVSVKSGATGPAHVRELKGTLEAEHAQIGVLFTLNEPTDAMRSAAAAAGFYKSEWGDFPRVQLISARELFEGKRIAYPHAAASNVTVKRSRAVKRPKAAQTEMLLVHDASKGTAQASKSRAVNKVVPAKRAAAKARAKKRRQA